MYKNQLQELAQRSCFNFPSYSCIREGPDHAPRFKATVNFNGETFESPTFCSTLRQAEHAAAEVALNTLAERGPSRALAAKILDETGVYKNLLQETAHRAGLNLPIYTTIRLGLRHVPLFSCTVELGGMSFMGEPARTKKQAQKNAAITAWVSLKRLAQQDSSTSVSAFSSSSGSKDYQEQDQVVIARALASLLSKSAATSNCLGKLHSPIPVSRDLNPPSLYPMHAGPWAYPNYAPGFAVYQMWQQQHYLQFQSHPLRLPSPTSPALIPHSYAYSIIHPDHGLYLAGVEEPHSRISIASSGMFFNSPIRNQSTVTIQEIHEEKAEETSGSSLSVSVSEHPVSPHPSVGQTHSRGSVIVGDNNQKAVESENKVEIYGSSGKEFQQVERVSVVSDRNLRLNYARPRHQPKPISSSGPSFRPQSFSTICRTPPQNSPSFASAPARMKTGSHSCSAMSRPERINFGVVHPKFRAPPVRIRSVTPVCSAPPPRQVCSSDQDEPLAGMEKKDHVSGTSSGIGKRQI
ncbi:PREDICTED: double-stranded RNA-binding protein 2-like isoform X2 [Tarenaya hassleriana]|nr:PREDICTED: double-stranded RNA-binding protein 2-like isoform X2 [Tarenaya hassleriana]